VNGLPDRVGQVPFNSGSQALNWIASSSNYFAVGPDYYPQVNADKLLMYVDGNQVISYPTTGSTWYDLSGYNGLGTLVNGPTFNSNGWFTFDGADDYINLGNSSIYSAGNQLSAFAWVYIGSNSVYQVIMSRIAPGYVTGWELANSSGVLRATMRGSDNNLSAGGLTVGRWYYVGFTYDGLTLSLYRNGELQGTNNGASTLNSTADLNIATRFNGSDPFNGNIANAQLYSGSLSLTDIQQNYYGGPIVTGSISGSYQAGNLVSFAPGTTTTFNMAANIISGSLQNGVAFNPTNGGYWSFDGADDRILLEGSTTNAWILNSGDTWTVTAWIRVPNGSSTSSGLDYQGILSNTSGGPIYSVFHIVNTVIAYSHYNGAWLTEIGSTPVNDGNWHMLTWVNESNDITFYTDNIPNGTFDSTISGVGWLDVIGSSLGRAFLGDIASLQINQGKAFTASEVLQQYNATK
jgi:hypothetical protein